MMGKDRKNILIMSLVLIVVFLLGLVGYAFLISPAITGFVTGEQNKGIQQGVQYAIYSIMQQAASCNPQGVPITFANQTMHVIALECSSKPTQ